MQLVVNGVDRSLTVEEPVSLSAVLAALDLKPDRIAVEHNGRIARRATWAETAVHANDKLEIVHFVGGGCGTHRTSCAAHEVKDLQLTEYVLSDIASSGLAPRNDRKLFNL